MISGHCLCGAVAFLSEGKPLWVAHCHCASCRRNTGAAFATFVGVRAGSFRYTRGAPQRFESSPGVFRSFCGRCGTPLTYEAAKYPDEVHIDIGALDEPERFRPQAHVHVAEQLPWLELSDSRPRFARTARDGPPLDRT